MSNAERIAFCLPKRIYPGLCLDYCMKHLRFSRHLEESVDAEVSSNLQDGLCQMRVGIDMVAMLDDHLGNNIQIQF